MNLKPQGFSVDELQKLIVIVLQDVYMHTCTRLMSFLLLSGHKAIMSENRCFLRTFQGAGQVYLTEQKNSFQNEKLQLLTGLCPVAAEWTGR